MNSKGLLIVFIALLSISTALPPAASAQDFDYYTPKILDQSKRNAPFLPDFSYVGYHWGEKPIPHLAPDLNVVDFGAVPSDGKDDTAAILAAVEAAHQLDGTAVVYFPPGRFILKEIIWIDRDNFVLQGSGSGEGGTIIDFPRPLWDMDFSRVADKLPWIRSWLDNNRVHQSTPFAFQGGIIWPLSPPGPKGVHVADVRRGKRNGHELIVDASHPIEVGGVYKMTRTDPNAPGSLLRHVLGDVDMEAGVWTQTAPIFEYVTVTKVRGNRITVKEPLFHDVRKEWNTVLESEKFREEIGIEGIRFECSGRTEYRGHHTARGYNPIGLAHVRNGWVRDVAIDNADSGILSRRCYLVTFEDITVTGEIGAHYGVQIGVGQRCLARNVSADMNAIHVLSVNTLAHGIVYSNCVVRRGRLDQHVGLNWQCLFDDIIVREAEYGWGVFGHGGNAGTQFPLHAAFNTFWNLRMIYDTDTIQDIPHPIYGSIIPGAAVRLVCFRANVPIRIQYYNVDPYIEGTNRVIDDKYASLYNYQLEQRLGENHPSVKHVKGNLDVGVYPISAEVNAGEEVIMKGSVFNREYSPRTLQMPDGKTTTMEWLIWPLDEEAHRNTGLHTENAVTAVPDPGADYMVRAGMAQLYTDWFAPIRFPKPGTYAVTLVYRNPEGTDLSETPYEIYSNTRVITVK